MEKDNYFQIPIYDKTKEGVKRISTTTIKVDNVKEAKQFAKSIRDKMLKDILHNPQKWLHDKNGGVQDGV